MTLIRSFLSWILFLIFAEFTVIGITFAQGTDCSIAATAIETASKLRGLSVKRNVPCKLQDQKQVEQYLRDTLERKIPPERIENEGWAYRMLGIVPPDYKYLDGLIQLYTSQLGGYYDAEKDYYAMASWIPAAMQMPIAVHELTHALQDQHFDLDKLVDPKNEDSDTLMARSALVEGDATAVMMDYARGLSGQGPVADEASVSGIMMQNLAGAMLSSAMQSAPQALQAILIFPYVSGLNFVHALLKVDKYPGVDKAFTRLPASTEEILHPKKYLAKKHDYIELKDPAPPKSLKVSEKPIFSDRIGEFTIATFLGSWIPPLRASEAAAGWGGDRLVLYARQGQPQPVLVWVLHWDTKQDADEFFSVLAEAYTKRFGKEPVKSSVLVSFLQTDFGKVEIQLNGETVTLTIGG